MASHTEYFLTCSCGHVTPYEEAPVTYNGDAECRHCARCNTQLSFTMPEIDVSDWLEEIRNEGGAND